MIPSKRQPSTPGEILKEEFLEPLGMTQLELAEKMDVPIQRVNGIVNGRRSITAETAILLARALKTTPEFWMTLQTTVDLWHARRKLSET
jgi:addiction module HigA family antidote